MHRQINYQHIITEKTLKNFQMSINNTRNKQVDHISSSNFYFKYSMKISNL